MTRVLVTGGRNFRDRDKAWAALDKVHASIPITCIIQGGASGADYIACRWARERGAAQLEFQAEWSRLGRAAGPIRNTVMLADGEPDLVIAFPGGRGTADMCRQAKEARLPVWRVEE